MLYWLIVFFAIIILGSPAGLSNVWLQSLASLFALANIRVVSKFYLFWFLLLINAFCASEPRFSIEYILLAAGFSAYGLSPTWQNLAEKKRRKFLLIVFLSFIAFNFLGISFAEKGSMLLWLPIFLAIFFQKKDKSGFFEKSNLINSITQILGLVALKFINKKTALIAGYTTLINYVGKKWLWYLFPLGITASLFIQDSLKHFIDKSLIARLYIWQSSFNGFIHSPVWGHGFGTYALDNPLYKITADNYGARAHQQIIHGHSTLMHLLFEQGLIGLTLLSALAYAVYQKDKKLLIPFSIIMLLDSSLFCFSQYLLASLILFPYISNDSSKFLRFVSATIPEKLSNAAGTLALIITGLMFTMSCTGHYFYITEKFNTAIKIDRYNALYYFMRGAKNYSNDTIQAEEDFAQAVKLAPGVGYFYGFLASAKLSNFKFPEADKYSREAMRLSGKEGSWYFINALANYGNRDYYQRQIQEAYRADPPLREIMEGRLPRSLKCIGKARRDPRIQAFYRRGKKVFLPIPQLPSQSE